MGAAYLGSTVLDGTALAGTVLAGTVLAGTVHTRDGDAAIALAAPATGAARLQLLHQDQIPLVVIQLLGQGHRGALRQGLAAKYASAASQRQKCQATGPHQAQTHQGEVGSLHSRCSHAPAYLTGQERLIASFSDLSSGD